MSGQVVIFPSLPIRQTIVHSFLTSSRFRPPLRTPALLAPNPRRTSPSVNHSCRADVEVAVEGVYDLAMVPGDALAAGAVAKVDPATGHRGRGWNEELGWVVTATGVGSTTARVRLVPGIAWRLTRKVRLLLLQFPGSQHADSCGLCRASRLLCPMHTATIFT